jgi:hypothetical protein
MLTAAATTTLTAATHSIDHAIEHSTASGGLAGLVLLALLALAVTGGLYLGWCWLFPFTHCPHPHHATAWRCRRCDGTHYRLRVGRVFLNWLRETRGRAR